MRTLSSLRAKTTSREAAEHGTWTNMFCKQYLPELSRKAGRLCSSDFRLPLLLPLLPAVFSGVFHAALRQGSQCDVAVASNFAWIYTSHEQAIPPTDTIGKQTRLLFLGLSVQEDGTPQHNGLFVLKIVPSVATTHRCTVVFFTCEMISYFNECCSTAQRRFQSQSEAHPMYLCASPALRELAPGLRKGLLHRLQLRLQASDLCLRTAVARQKAQANRKMASPPRWRRLVPPRKLRLLRVYGEKCFSSPRGVTHVFRVPVMSC